MKDESRIGMPGGISDSSLCSSSDSDMFYETELGAAVFHWLADLAKKDIKVLIGDPGRHALPPSLREVATYELPEWLQKDNRGFTSASVYELDAHK